MRSLHPRGAALTRAIDRIKLKSACVVFAGEPRVTRETHITWLFPARGCKTAANKAKDAKMIVHTREPDFTFRCG